MRQVSKITRNIAESLAIQALAFLAEEPQRLADFLSLSGIGPQTIRRAAADPAFLAGVLDHVAADESLLLAFAGGAGVDPGDIGKARAALADPGPGQEVS
jgi:uncharacterized protein DUF3572